MCQPACASLTYLRFLICHLPLTSNMTYVEHTITHCIGCLENLEEIQVGVDSWQPSLIIIVTKVQ